MSQFSNFWYKATFAFYVWIRLGTTLDDILAKLFEGLLISRLTTHTEHFNTLTYNQLGTKPDTQTHGAIYSLFAIIQHNKYSQENPIYVAFVDYSTAYPSVHRLPESGS